MLRRDFLTAIASFTAAAAAAKAAFASTKTPQEKAGEWIRATFTADATATDGAALVPPEFVQALDSRSAFERQLIECLRDGSVRLIGVTPWSRGGYRAFYRAAEKGDRSSDHEKTKADSLLLMHERGVVYVDSVTVYNDYDGVEVFFSVCS